MSTAPPSDSDQMSPASEQDHVFNDETCRALRRLGREWGRVGAVVGTFGLGLYGMTIVTLAVSISPFLNFVLGVTLSTVVAVATVTVMRWVNLVPTPETIREAWTEMTRNLRQEVREYAGDPKAIETRVLEDTTDPTARPELAFGLAPEECAVIGAPLGLLVVGIGTVEATILFTGVCLALSGILFVAIRYSPAKVSTYPPEHPP